MEGDGEFTGTELFYSQLGIEQDDDFTSSQCPLKLTASVEGMKTRANATYSWIDGDRIRIDTYP